MSDKYVLYAYCKNPQTVKIQARLSAEAAGLGGVSFMQLEAPTGRICAVGSGEQVIVVLAETGVNVGRVRVELLRAAVEVVALGRADFR